MASILFHSPKVESITHKVVDYFASDSRVFAVILYGSTELGGLFATRCLEMPNGLRGAI